MVLSQGTSDSQSDQQNNAVEGPAPVADAGSTSTSRDGNRKVSWEDIEHVHNLIERCLLLYKNKDEVIKMLSDSAMIEPAFTSLVWRKLEEENAAFFQAYNIRLKLKKQIVLFNELLDKQYHLMKSASLQNGNNCIPVNNFPMGYPNLQPPIPTMCHDSMIVSSCHVENGVPAPNNIQMNSGNDAVIENGVSDQTAAASNGCFDFTAPEMGIDTSALDTTFMCDDVVNTPCLQVPSDNCDGNYKNSLGEFLWDFSLSEDPGALGNYHGSPFLHFD